MDFSHPATLESISKGIILPSVPRPLKNLYRREPMALGITQICIGILVIAFGITIAVAEQTHKYSYGAEHIMTPYWTGIPYIISGSLSVVMVKKPEIPLVKGILVMHVVSTIAAGIAIVILSMSASYARHYICESNHDEELPPEICKEFIKIPYFQIRYTSAVLLAFSFLEFFIAIVTAAFGCAALCLSTFNETTVVIFQGTGPPAVLTPVKEEVVL